MIFSLSKHRSRSYVVSPVALALGVLASSAWAQTAPAPDAGSVLRDLLVPPVLSAPLASPLQDPRSPPEASSRDEARALIKAIVITGNQALPTAELLALVADLPGTEQTLSQLNAAVRRITAHYRERGFAVARAYLPAQDMTNGTVTIGIVEGRVSRYQINNKARLSGARAEGFFSQIKAGDVIKSAQIDRGLLLLQDTPGVAASRATLQPGASVGTSELLIELDPAKAYGVNLALDNHGIRYTGEYRLGGTFNLASPLNIGDQLSFAGLTSGSHLRYGRLAYQFPLGGDGLRLGAAYFDTRYTLGREFASLDANGRASSTSVFAVYPLVRSQFFNLSTSAAYENKRLNDRVDSTATVTEKRTSTTSLGLAGNMQDAWGGGGINTFELSLALGRLSIDSPNTLAIDAASARSNGLYSRVSYSAGRLQRLTDATRLSVSLVGQKANKNLDSSEKFSLGGANAVRAYPQGEAVGDEGQRASVELQHTLTGSVQGLLFYDVGRVTASKNPFGPAAANSRTLAGAGIGLDVTFTSLRLRSSLAWRTHGGAPTSTPQDSTKTPTIWFQATTVF
jgi:hemolysin activation/secretion protein